MTSKLKLTSKLVVAVGAVCIAVAAWIVMARWSRPTSPPPAKEIPRHDLAQKDGRWYHQSETNPFTGWMVDYYPSGARLSRSQISNGLPNGLSESWYPNGQMQVREHFKDGVSHGQREKWHENGSRLSVATIVDGKVTGTFQSWHENGQLSERIEMKLGRADGVAWAYYPSGFVKAETTVRDGQVLNRKSWRDGEQVETAVR